MNPITQNLTIREVAAFLHVAQSTVYKLICNQNLPCFRLGFDYRIRRDALLAWVAASERLQSSVAEVRKKGGKTSWVNLAPAEFSAEMRRRATKRKRNKTKRPKS